MGPDRENDGNKLLLRACPLYREKKRTRKKSMFSRTCSAFQSVRVKEKDRDTRKPEGILFFCKHERGSCGFCVPGESDSRTNPRKEERISIGGLKKQGKNIGKQDISRFFFLSTNLRFRRTVVEKGGVICKCTCASHQKCSSDAQVWIMLELGFISTHVRIITLRIISAS